MQGAPFPLHHFLVFLFRELGKRGCIHGDNVCVFETLELILHLLLHPTIDVQETLIAIGIHTCRSRWVPVQSLALLLPLFSLLLRQVVSEHDMSLLVVPR